MVIALHDAEYDHMPDKSLPNFALMKILAYHKAQGDNLEWWNALNNSLYDRVYSSKVFDFTPENLYLPEHTIRGGTGYRIYNELPPEIDSCFPDYSIYPKRELCYKTLEDACKHRNEGQR